MTVQPNQIPDWTPNGVLPANDPNEPTSPARSPYTVSLVDLVVRFGFTEARRNLLTGLLDLRAELHGVGLSRGFQWINGSFVEQTEATANRSPNDIDLVTFFHIPPGATIESLWQSHQDLLSPQIAKAKYQTDAYFAPLNPNAPDDIVRQTIYWYSLWSHNRNGIWKGFLEIDLAGTEDRNVRRILEQLDTTGGEP